MKLRYSYFLLILFCALSACSSGVGGFLSGGSGNITNPVGTPDTGTTNLEPEGISLPLSFLSGDVNSAFTATYAPDSSGHDPIIGFAGSVDTSSMTDSNGDGYADGYFVATSDSSLEETTANNWSWIFMSTAHAETTNTICSRSGVMCWPITMTGEFEAYPSAASQHYIYITDGTKISTGITATPITHLLWLAKAPKEITNGPTDFTYEDNSANVFWALTQDIGAAIIETDDIFKVVGSHGDSYKMFDAAGTTQLAYDSDNHKLGSNILNSGLPIDSFAATDLVSTAFSLDGTTTVPDTEIYNKVKYTADGKLRFVRKPNSGKGIESIYYGVNSGTDEITFFDSSDSTSLGIDNVTNTIAFDVESSGTGLVLFEGNDSSLRFRMAYPSGRSSSYTRLGGTSYLGLTCAYDSDGLCNYRDLQIYRENSSPTEYGRALLLDKDNNRVGSIRYNYQDGTGSAVITWIALGDGKTPVAIVFNSDKSKAYILNQGDGTVSVLSLTNAQGSPLRAANITIENLDLKTYLNGISATITPTSLTYTTSTSGKNYLVVMSEGLKGAIVVDLETATLTAE